MKIVTTNIRCSMGASSEWIKIPGITANHGVDLNEIGYSGKLKGKEMSLTDYLDQISTETHKYSIVRTGGNGMEFTDKYIVIAVIIEIPSKDDSNLEEMIKDIITSDVHLRDVPYSMENGAKEIDPKSATDAAKSIIKMVKGLQ
jgi:hypothetical protein